MVDPDIRWKHRLANYRKAAGQLGSAVDLARTRELSELERQGLIQAFEFTHELAWNVMKDYFALVSRQPSIVGFSWSVRVQGKARLAGNGHSPFQEAQRSHGRGQTNPSGAPVVSRRGVAVLDKGMAIACAPRLAAKHHRNAEPGNRGLTGHWGNTAITGSRDAIREAFQNGLIEDGEGWMEMIRSRNQTAHAYNEKVAAEIAARVVNRYRSLFRQFLQRMEQLEAQA